MKTKASTTIAPDPAHRDPITGEPGTHMLGTSVGAVAVGAVGTALGVAVAGPVGGLVGATIGPMLGGLAGHEIAETMDPTIPPTGHAQKSAGAEYDHPLLDRIESVPIHRDPSEADTITVDLGPSFHQSVKAAAAATAAQSATDPIEQRATEIARRQGRHQVADSDRRRAFVELKDEGATV